MSSTVFSQFDVAGFGVIVTGGASGLGLAYGEVLASHGARVTLIDLNPDAVAAQASRLQADGLDVSGAVTDVTDHTTLDRVIDEAAAAYGRLDVAFANAGIDPGAGFLSLDSSGPTRVQDMRPRRSGRIILTTSIAATVAAPLIGSAYLAAKAGARHFMHSIALELTAYGITANAIAPGFFATNIAGGHTKDPEVQAVTARMIPMHRVAQPDDIKALALFLASPASVYITGQEIVIDGGMSLGLAD
jgi:NAD(P)-dependent dehydrogenase (short-subunit alcohol dehydrogenase family)